MYIPWWSNTCFFVVVDAKSVLEDPAHALFLWCVLMRCKDLAMCFWEESNVSVYTIHAISVVLCYLIYSQTSRVYRRVLHNQYCIF